MTQQDKPETPRDESETAANPESTESGSAPETPEIEPEIVEDAEPAPGDAGLDAEALAAELDEARAKADQYRDQAVRAHAEMENVRKRAQREAEAARKFAIEKFVTELLGVRDSLELGLQAAEENHGDFQKLKEGMDMTHRMLASSMEKAGVEVINPQGEPFNPEYHEAVSTQPSDDLPDNSVAAVMQKGYMLNGRVLRAAMVTVAKSAN